MTAFFDVSRSSRRRFPETFLFGCASAAHQVEGGLENDWTEMEAREGTIHDGSRSGVACDHYNRYAQDLELCASLLHNNAHRFSVEWSRIEPAQGVFDPDALAHYRDVSKRCRELGLEPLVTLHHFTLPLWLAHRGGILAPEAPRLFARFAAVVAETIGADVRWWITINEPSVYAVMSRLMGTFPPNSQSLPEALRAYRGLLRMHAAAATAIRTVARKRGFAVNVSVAHHERRLRPAEPDSLLDTVVAWLPDYLFNRWFLRSCVAGRILPPVGVGESVMGLRGSLDYIGLNYYCEEIVNFDIATPQTVFARQSPMPALSLDAFGNGIYPQGLRLALQSLWDEFGLPIVITENGVADTNDELRADYLLDHLGVTLDALDAGVDVRGYLYWTQMDNFEWNEGYAPKFGLFSVDPRTMERHPKPSARLFGAICASRELPSRAKALEMVSA